MHLGGEIGKERSAGQWVKYCTENDRIRLRTFIQLNIIIQEYGIPLQNEDNYTANVCLKNETLKMPSSRNLENPKGINDTSKKQHVQILSSLEVFYFGHSQKQNTKLTCWSHFVTKFLCYIFEIFHHANHQQQLKEPQFESHFNFPGAQPLELFSRENISVMEWQK